MAWGAKNIHAVNNAETNTTTCCNNGKNISVCNLSTAKLLFRTNNRVDVKVSIARRLVSRLIKPGDKTK